MKKFCVGKSAFLLLFPTLLFAQKPSPKSDSQIDYSIINSLKFRSIGPAVTSGRVGDIAIHPQNPSTWYIAAASGGIWKTTNSGTTFNPVFDGQGSYSIGCLAIDPNNPNVIWAGTGENNNQRSVGYGDGIYKSEDGGASWKNMGLAKSEHIGRICIDPRNSNILYVAAYGPLWSSGGERGIYKTTDGGKSWERILHVSDNTGFNEVHFQPGNPDVLYATAHQRRRHEWTYISGGPESGIYRSVDAGKSWEKLSNGLPGGEMGRIGLALPPSDPNRIYAIVEAGEDDKGVYMSTNRGASWEKRSSWATAGNYYQEIVAHPTNANCLYSLDTWAMVSYDGGKSFSGLGERNKHVDNHALYVWPEKPEHLLMGCDGGLYESFDHGQNWKFFANLPITQFYRVCADTQQPYWVYAGTQDNNTLGGPSATRSASGIVNADWFVTVGGDGFESQVDPSDPNTVYSQWQYGGLVRHDRRTGESYDIKPMEALGDSAFRWNWDAPLLLSPHNSKRLYFGANVLFKSDDRGQSWQKISGDLTRQIDRNALPVMGRVWSMDAVAKNQSTSIYGNLTALSESPVKEGVLVVGTDDGLIQITRDGGKNWTRIERIAGVPERTLVHAVLASRHNENRIITAYNNHRNGDFKPYICISDDGGKTWSLSVKGLPDRGSVYCLAEDPKDANLLYAGTEFGLYISKDLGKNWIAMKAGLPTICVRDIEIQEESDDLILATFGRGIYILDQLHWLRELLPLAEEKSDAKAKATFLSTEPYALRVLATPLGHKGKSFQGAAYYTADNPTEGMQISWQLNTDYKTAKKKRKEREAEELKQGKDSRYPHRDSIVYESSETEAFQLLHISDAEGNLVRSQQFPASKGMHNYVWDGKMNSTGPINFRTPDPDNPYDGGDAAAPALPGIYAAQVFVFNNGKFDTLSAKHHIELTSSGKIDATFNKELAELRRVLSGIDSYLNHAEERFPYYKATFSGSVKDYTELREKSEQLNREVQQLRRIINGESSLSRREFEVKPGLSGRLDNIVYNLWSTTQEPSQTYREQLNIVADAMKQLYKRVQALEEEITQLEEKLDIMGAPATPGRLPLWRP
ncbi:MAG: glycosyl hydrolase [Bacteroidia bacterium]